MNSLPDESLPLGDPTTHRTSDAQWRYTCSDILIAAANVFGRNLPLRFGTIWPKLIESQLNRNG
jgi:hypothetical protein